MNKKRLSLLARCIVGAALLALIFYKVDIVQVLKGLRAVQARYLVAAYAIGLFGNLIASFRWKVMLNAKGIVVPVRKLYSFYLVGFFFNMFLPTTVGGDVVRAVDLSQYTRRTADSFSSILLERTLGLMALSIMACLAMVLFFQLHPNYGLLAVTIGFTVLIGLMLILLLGWPSLIDAFRVILKRISYRNIGERIDRGLASILSYRKLPLSLIGAIVISFLYQICYFVGLYVLSLSLDMDLSLLYVFIFMPIITIICNIPISLNAIGIREGAFIYCFKWAGIPASQSLALSLLFFSMTVLLSIIGGIIYSLRGFIQEISDHV